MTSLESPCVHRCKTFEMAMCIMHLMSLTTLTSIFSFQNGDAATYLGQVIRHNSCFLDRPVYCLPLTLWAQIHNHVADCKVSVKSISGLPKFCKRVCVSFHLPSDAAATAATVELDDSFGFCCDLSQQKDPERLAESRHSSPWYHTSKGGMVATEWVTSTFMTLSPEIEMFFVNEALCFQVCFQLLLKKIRT